MIELRWTGKRLPSLLHAAEGLARGWPPADRAFAEAVSPVAEDLVRQISAAGVPLANFWRHLTAQSLGIESTRQLVRVALAKTLGRADAADSLATPLAACVAELDSIAVRAAPKLVEELALRARPLREAWEACGPGMLHELAAITESAVVVGSAEVAALHPTFGGAGTAHLQYNSVRIEAVLANPVPGLPEVVRLAWLLAQLNLDVPVYSERIHGERLPHIAALAMLPVALTAAERVELSRCDEATIRAALATWRLDLPSGVDAAGLLLDWWPTYIDSRGELSFATALTALDRMIG